MPPEARTWFIDRCLGKRLCAAVRALGAEAEWHGDHFADDADDEVWIPYAAGRGWPILTKDKNIRRDENQRRIVVACRAWYVCLGSGTLGADEQIARVTESWRTITGVIATRSPPTILNITKTGVDELDLARHEWRRVKKKRA